MTIKDQIDSISLLPEKKSPTFLLVMLHGWGANCEDFVDLARSLDLPEFGYFFPNAPFNHPQIVGGRAWYELESAEYKGLEQSQQLLLTWLKSLNSETGVPLANTFVAGFSQGGAMTLDVALKLPVAGICSMSGYLHYEPKPLINTPPPVLITHGTQDLVVPIDVARQAREQLSAINVGVQYQEFEMGHEITPPVWELLKQFIQESKKS